MHPSSLRCSAMSCCMTDSISSTWRDMFPLYALDHRIHQLFPRPAGHVLGQMLIEHRVVRLPGAAAVEQARAKWTLAHLLEQRAVKRLRHQFLGLLDEL